MPGLGLRDVLGGALVLGALGAVYLAVRGLEEHDFVGAVLLTVTGLSLLRAGVELMRWSLGE